MIIDFHAIAGNSPRTGRNWSLHDLEIWADRCGLDVLIVECADARIRMLDEPLDELLRSCRASGNRFLPAATIVLESDAHSLHVARTARARGFVAVVLHGRLFEESRVLREVLDELRQAPVPIYRELPYEELDAAFRLARAYPDLRFVFAARSWQALELNHRLCELPNVYFSCAHTLYSLGQLETACRVVGADRLLYASDLPQQHPGRPLGAVFDAEISDADRSRILGGTALELLAAHGVVVPPSNGAWTPPEPPCRIIDTHGHIGSDYRRPDFDSSLDAVLRFLDRAGGELMYVSDVEAIFGDVVAGNRRTLQAMRAYPARIRGYLVINPWMEQRCLDDVQRCREVGFAGLKPYPGVFGHNLSDPVMEPVWQLAEALKLPVLCHSDAADLRRVLEKRPTVRMLAAHMSFEYAEKAQLAREFPHVVLEISGAGAGVEDVIRAVQIAGEDKLVFGSDLNSIGLRYTLFPVLCSGLPERTVRAILRENAVRFFQIPL